MFNKTLGLKKNPAATVHSTKPNLDSNKSSTSTPENKLTPTINLPEKIEDKNNKEITNKQETNINTENKLNNNTRHNMTTILNETPTNASSAKIDKNTIPALSKEPIRVLPSLIEELLKKNISVKLTTDGYLIGGFYGAGYIRLQDSIEKNVFIAFDHKDKKHLIKSFDDLIVLNKEVWKFYYKKDKAWKKADQAWFDYMLEAGVLAIAPK